MRCGMKILILVNSAKRQQKTFNGGQFYVGNVPVPPDDVKVDIELELSAWLVEYFRQQAGERDLAALINRVLKQAVVDDTARQIAEFLREEGEQQPVLA